MVYSFSVYTHVVPPEKKTQASFKKKNKRERESFYSKGDNPYQQWLPIISLLHWHANLWDTRFYIYILVL